MSRETRNKVNMVWRYVILLAVGVVMVYPLVWMIGASFMTNEQIFSSVSCIPRFPTLSGYKKGFEGYQGMTLLHFMVNTYKFVIPKVLFTVASATLTAYGFARFNFIGKRFSFQHWNDHVPESLHNSASIDLSCFLQFFWYSTKELDQHVYKVGISCQQGRNNKRKIRV